MKQFNFKDNIFQWFSHKFHREDTYKNPEGKEGILERFLQVSAEYLDESVITEVDNILNLIDIDVTPEKYIPLIWEYMGFIPYAYGLYTKGEPYTESDFNQNKFPITNYRDLLKYAVSLYKIRCTSNFYTVLGRFYNVTFSLVTIGSEKDSTAPTYNSTARYGKSDKYDRQESCLECVSVNVTVLVPLNVMETLISEGRKDQATDAMCLILNKYRPINVREFDHTNVFLYANLSNLDLNEES